jgi:hypothetical protein
MGDVLGNSYDMRGGQSKKSDEAGKAIGSMGKGSLHLVFLIFLALHHLSIYLPCDMQAGEADFRYRQRRDCPWHQHQRRPADAEPE